MITRPGRFGGGAAILGVLIATAIGLFLLFGDLSTLMGGGGGAGGGGGGGGAGGTGGGTTVGGTTSGGGGGSYVGKLGATRGSARQLRNDVNLAQIATCVSIFRDQHGRLPRDVSELDLGSFTNDYWGRPLHIRFEGPPDATNMRVISDGEDGIAGNEDDLEDLEGLPY